MRIKSILSVAGLLSLILTFTSCKGMKNNDRPAPGPEEPGYFVTVSDGLKIFIYEYIPVTDFKHTIYIISGITGINHNNEKDIIGLLSDNKYRVVVIHPRGTGYSEGRRGDIDDFSGFISDYTEIIKGDRFFKESTRKTFLFGHSMSCAVALQVAAALHKTDGLIMVNPPLRLKPSGGMTPGIRDYVKYAGYYVFAPHVPVVNMSGDPAVIENESDRLESVLRNNDSLLVKYFSMHYMSESGRNINAMSELSKQADYPLLLLYGDNDMIVDKEGCDEIYSNWKNRNKSYKIIRGGTHGKSTVTGGAEIIAEWVKKAGETL